MGEREDEAAWKLLATSWGKAALRALGIDPTTGEAVEVPSTPASDHGPECRGCAHIERYSAAQRAEAFGYPEAWDRVTPRAAAGVEMTRRPYYWAERWLVTSIPAGARLRVNGYLRDLPAEVGPTDVLQVETTVKVEGI